ncbi:iron transporter FeoC [Vibrio scophthalmi]|uniref:FeoC-like transcriptional regulator n=1 Tax=Vibrio scophthalmi TaxID=45658 RepID=UPI002FF3B072
MIVSELKAYIDQCGTVTQAELAKRFSLSLDGVDAMLAIWLRKGKLSRLEDINETNHVIRVRYCAINEDALSLRVIL